MTTTTARTSALRAARAKDSQDKRRRVIAAIQALESAGVPITAAAVATAAGVSTWLVYADGIREHLDAARQRQTNHGDTPVPTTLQGAQPSATTASLRTDHDKLRNRLRLHLGAEIEGPQRAELIARVATLEACNRQLVADRDARTVEAQQAQRSVQELEDELTAARESLRRVIRDNDR
jgi:hypothetical protein